MTDQRPRIFTECFIQRGSRLLLPRKLFVPGHKNLGAGLNVGYGGEVEGVETLEQTNEREVREESGGGVTLLRVRRCGVLYETFTDGTRPSEVHFFWSDRSTGDPLPSDEMQPEWFRVRDLPYDNMWPNNASMLPLMLIGVPVIGRFHLDSLDHRRVIAHKVKLWHRDQLPLPGEIQGLFDF